jgi:hypothetical protein
LILDGVMVCAAHTCPRSTPFVATELDYATSSDGEISSVVDQRLKGGHPGGWAVSGWFGEMVTKISQRGTAACPDEPVHEVISIATRSSFKWQEAAGSSSRDCEFIDSSFELA